MLESIEYKQENRRRREISKEIERKRRRSICQIESEQRWKKDRNIVLRERNTHIHTDGYKYPNITGKI